MTTPVQGCDHLVGFHDREGFRLGELALASGERVEIETWYEHEFSRPLGPDVMFLWCPLCGADLRGFWDELGIEVELPHELAP